jgi:hypothetical protein
MSVLVASSPSLLSRREHCEPTDAHWAWATIMPTGTLSQERSTLKSGDYGKAAELFASLANKNDHVTELGLGVPRDTATAIDLYKQPACQNVTATELRLGKSICRGISCRLISRRPGCISSAQPTAATRRPPSFSVTFTLVDLVRLRPKKGIRLVGGGRRGRRRRRTERVISCSIPLGQNQGAALALGDQILLAIELPSGQGSRLVALFLNRIGDRRICRGSPPATRRE